MGLLVVSLALGILLLCDSAYSQALLSGHVVDETGAGIASVRVEVRSSAAGSFVVSSSDRAGNFKIVLPEAGEYTIRAERLGFYVYQSPPKWFETGPSDLTITLNHLQEFADRIDVTSSPPAIDPQEPQERRELDNTEIQSIPYPAPQDYRNALPLMDGVVLDNSGRAHFNGGRTNQTNYTLNGFNVSDPVTGQLEVRLNIDAIQSMDVVTSRFSAENGRGSTGVLDVKTKMGDDRWRLGGTNFVPGISTDSGWHVNKWTPRFEISGPIDKGRAWFHSGLDAFYSDDVVPGLPSGQNRTSSISASDLTTFQVDLTPGNILTGSFLYNVDHSRRSGLSFLNPVEATLNRRGALYMSTLRDQAYLAGGSLLEAGFADSRGIFDTSPQGNRLYLITPEGNHGNYFSGAGRHFYRQQWIANLFLPVLRAAGTHQLKFGIDFEREAFHQTVDRHPYQVQRADGSVTRYVTFVGNPFQARKNFEAAQYLQDAWAIRENLVFEAGLRLEWNEIVRDLEIAPRFAVAWAPGWLRATKFSAGWGVYHDAISLETVTRQQDQTSLSTFYLPNGVVQGPVPTSFLAEDRLLKTPRFRIVSWGFERKLPHDFYLKAGYSHRTGDRGFTFWPTIPLTRGAFYQGEVFLLTNARQDRYDAFDLSLRHTFAGKFEWFAGYTRSSARSSAAVEYSLENPIFGPQGPGPYPWDTPNRFHTWGWAPLPERLLPARLRFLVRNTTAQYLVEYRTGFPFSIVDEEGFLVSAPNSVRFPHYFNINLHFERQFRALHYLWAWRFGLNNLTASLNPNVVNNVEGTPQFLTFGGGQARAFSVRLRFLGRK
jgi:hypothetical protein